VSRHRARLTSRCPASAEAQIAEPVDEAGTATCRTACRCESQLRPPLMLPPSGSGSPGCRPVAVDVHLEIRNARAQENAPKNSSAQSRVPASPTPPHTMNAGGASSGIGVWAPPRNGVGRDRSTRRKSGTRADLCASGFPRRRALVVLAVLHAAATSARRRPRIRRRRSSSDRCPSPRVRAHDLDRLQHVVHLVGQRIVAVAAKRLRRMIVLIP
jgi:hypothetical protein